MQSCPEKLRGPGQRVKVGAQGQGGFHSESQLHPSCKLKTKKKKKKKSLHANNDNSYPSPTISPYFISLLHCSSEEYCDCSIRVYRSFKQVFKGPFMGPLSGWGPGQNTPVAPPPPPPPPVGSPDKVFYLS